MNTEQKFGLVNQQFGIIYDAIKNTQSDVNYLSANNPELDQLSDVNINSVVNGDTLVYNSTTSEWVNSAITVAAAGTLTGATLASNVLASSLTSVGTLAALTVTAPITGSVSGSSGSTTGNAATATALATPRAINGTNFEGIAAITVTADAGTLTGATLASNVLASSLTSHGTLVSGAVPASLVTAGTFGAGAYTFPGALVVASGNNVGIGIVAPLAVLNVKDSRTANSSSLLTSATGATVFIQPKYSSGYGIAFGSGPSDYPYMQTVTIAGNAHSPMLLNPYGGNVGIGTTTPSTILDVVGTGKFTTSASKTQLTVNGTGAIQSGINFANGGTNYGEIYFDNNAPYDMSIYQKVATGSLILGTNTTERMRITSAGNVGIGTTTPVAKFEVNGDVQSTSFFRSGTSSNSITIGASANANYNYIGHSNYWGIRTGTAYDFNIDVNNSGSPINVLKITQGGKVGIGTTAPNQTLEVKGADGTGIRLMNAGSSDKRYDIVGSGNDFRINETGVGASLTIKAGGNVGIGTTAPSVKLQVEGLVNSIDLVRLQALTGSGASDAGISFYAMATGANVDARNYKAVINNSAHGTFEIIQSTTNSNAPSVPVLSITKSGNVSTPTQSTAMGGLDAVFNMPLASTYYPLQFKTTAGPFSINIGSNWNNSTYTYTAPITGIYLICVGIYTDTVDRLGVFINGVRKINITGYPSIAGADIWTGSCMVSMTAADTLQFRSYSESVNAVIQYDAAYTFFQLRLLG